MADPFRTRPGDLLAAATGPDAAAGSAAGPAGSIRTALNLVLAPLADALDDAGSPLAPAQQERIALARRSAAALLALVEGMLEGAGPEPGSDASYVPTDLATAIRELVAMFRSAAALSDVEILVESPPLRQPVHVDRGMWERLVTALLNRALRSAHQKVSVRVSETPEAAVLEVTSAASDDDSGVIAMARRLAEAHGGTLDVESAVAGQSTVRVAVPFGAAHLPPERIVGGAPPASRRSLPRPAERVLVVADDPDLRGYLKGLVEGRWNAEAAVDLATALATSAENAPDLILIDGDARSGEGLALAHALRTDPRTKRVPMIMIGAAVQGLEREGAAAAGPDEYVTKPFASRDLVSRIAAHLQMSRVREEATRREQKARLDAEAANRAKDEFIAMISHELRTPLGAILIWAQLLRAEELDASATARAVGMIERSTKTLAQLIDDLLDVSRIIAGKLTFEARPVDLRFVVEAALRRGLDEGEFVCVYQPIVALATRRITSLEALVRWARPGAGLVASSEFVPVAEESGLIRAIGGLVLDEACAQARRWALRWPERHLPVAVNLSASEFQQRDARALVARGLERAGLEPSRLIVELTESTLLADPTHSAAALAELPALGVGLCVDDFGTGYSSLAYLRRIPARMLKLDRTFLVDVDVDPSAEAMVRGVTALAHALGLWVVAEGVERESQAVALAALGCDGAQGYLFAAPAAAADIEAMLAAESEPG